MTDETKQQEHDDELPQEPVAGPARYVLKNISIDNAAKPLPEDHVDALSSLAIAARDNARALEANAQAIQGIAKALKGPDSIMHHGIHIGG